MPIRLGQAPQFIERPDASSHGSHAPKRPFYSNGVRPQYHALTYNFGGLLPKLATPEPREPRARDGGKARLWREANRGEAYASAL